ncbi:hypothetical protein [Leisingera sp. ANG-DT]|uniref:hypothetical protein n=1 Tax=Leisingera sp. ANG-DT TaxID=1577897 RepID=UPI000580AA10|nr:hypothetical protein [Leisingera sp. ANG-DT]
MDERLSKDADATAYAVVSEGDRLRSYWVRMTVRSFQGDVSQDYGPVEVEDQQQARRWIRSGAKLHNFSLMDVAIDYEFRESK